MENTEYVFRLTAYDVQALLPQVSRALERRSELMAKTKFAGKKRIRAALNSSDENFHRRSSLITMLVGLAAVVLGVAAIVFGAMNSGEIFMLVLGAVLAAAGIFAVARSSMGKRNPYKADAAKLLQGKDKFRAEDNIRIVFNSEGMRTARSFIPYREFQCWIETQDLLLFMYGPLVTMLQKTDLIEGSLGDFRRLALDNILLHAKIAGSPDK